MTHGEPDLLPQAARLADEVRNTLLGDDLEPAARAPGQALAAGAAYRRQGTDACHHPT
jgi:hypothetical protein